MIEQLSTKQQEIRNRESRIVSIALKLFDSHGYVGLTIEDIARKMGYSKGTIYNHFPNKEEILLELVNRSLNIWNSLLLSAVRLRIPSRDKVIAALASFELFNENCQEYFRITPILRVDGIMDKTTNKRQVAHGVLEANWRVQVSEIARHACVEGDLPLKSEYESEVLVAGLCRVITMKHDAIGLDHGAPGQVRSPAVNRYLLNHLLNGCAWSPVMDIDQMNQRLEGLKNELRSSLDKSTK